MSPKRFAIYCLLLAAFNSGVVVAQTHLKKKHSHNKAAVQKQLPTLPPEPDIHFNPYWERPEVNEMPFDSTHIYTYADQMPTTLNGRNVVTSSMQIISQLIVVPPSSPSGRVFVRFEIDKQGYVRHAEIAKGLRADLDSAVVTAARKLPRFTPGKQSGQAVRVSVTIAVTIPERKQP